MPTKPKTYPFAIYRTDNTYLIHDLTRKDYEQIMDDLQENKQFSPVSIGVIGLSDMRAIIEQKPPEPEPEKPKKKEKPAVPDMTLEEMQDFKRIMQGIYEDEDEGVDYQ